MKHHDIIVQSSGQLLGMFGALPSSITAAGENASRRFIEFFTANIRNRNTRIAYAHAVRRFFDWCEGHHIPLDKIEPILVAAYIEEMGQSLDVPSVKQHLAAIRGLFDYLVVGQVIKMNPAAAVRGPKHVVTKGKTPVLTPEEAHELFDSIVPLTIADMRDRALIGVMVYSFARVGAVVAMNIEDYYQQGKRFWFRLHEKGGKRHEVPAHHKAEEYLDSYIAAAGIADQRGSPLFRTLSRKRTLSDRRLHRLEVLAMIKRRSRKARLSPDISCHTFRATGITAYLLNGGTLEHAQRIAAHSSPGTTKLYDRTSDAINLDEFERITI